MNAMIATTFIMANQDSNSPNDPTEMRLVGQEQHQHERQESLRDARQERV
jgi:hypothetical protein